MIYGHDEAIAFPVADLYDTGIMQMYISAVRDQYQQGLKDYENFMSKYGDFMSPFRKDVDMWNNEVMGPTMDLINKMYEAGIDPTRNQEARAMIQQSMRNVPYGKIAVARQNAKVGEEYIKARGALAAKGLYDKDYTDFWLREQGLKPFEEWSSEDGAWNIASPIQYKDLFTATDEWFKGMKPHELTAEQVRKSLGTYDPNYKYVGIPEEDLYEVTNNKIPGFMNSIEGRYYRDKVKRELEAAGIDPTDENVNKELADRIVTANHAKVVDPTSDADEFAKLKKQHSYQVALENLRTANNIKEHDAKNASDLYYTALEYGADTDGDGKLSGAELKAFTSSSAGAGGGRRKGRDIEYNIFRESESNEAAGMHESHADFLPKDLYDLKIDPKNAGIQFIPETDDEPAYYNVPEQSKSLQFFSHESVYSRGTYLNPFSWKNNNRKHRFVPGTSLHTKVMPDGTLRYFISGRLQERIQNPEFDKSKKDDEVPEYIWKTMKDKNGNDLFEMEVIERDHVYGQRKTK